MCIIASVPRGRTIEEDKLRTMWKHNPDGAGISYIDDSGKIQVFKTMKLKEFMKEWEVIQLKAQSDLLVHMRIATHGSVCLDNNHPFYVDTQTVFAHNGVMPRSFHPPAKRDISDTRYFNETFLQHVKLTGLDDNRFIDHLGEVIGSYNKLVILSANPKLHKESYIINESSGEWAEGIWYSNDSYLERSLKMRGGTSSYLNTLPTSRVSDDGGWCEIPDPADAEAQLELDKQVCHDWKLMSKTDWNNAPLVAVLEDAMAEYGYDAPQDFLEDLALHVRDGKLQCQLCEALWDDQTHDIDHAFTCTADPFGKYEYLSDEHDDGTDPRREQQYTMTWEEAQIDEVDSETAEALKLFDEAEVEKGNKKS